MTNSDPAALSAEELDAIDARSSAPGLARIMSPAYCDFIVSALGDVRRLLAEVRRLRAVIRKTHDNHCGPSQMATGRHAPECLLYEIEP